MNGWTQKGFNGELNSSSSKVFTCSKNYWSVFSFENVVV